MKKIKIVIIGNGMVGHRFIEELIDKTTPDQFDITVFCAENYPAYDRVHLSSFLLNRASEVSSLMKDDYYENNNVKIFTGECIVKIDRDLKIVYSQSEIKVNYDKLIIATGSCARIPKIKGIDGDNCFVYRTIDDIDAIKKYIKKKKKGVVIGGGLLGLEIAGVLNNMGIDVNVVEYSNFLMADQLDSMGSLLLSNKIEETGINVNTNKKILSIRQKSSNKYLEFDDGSSLKTDFIIIATGINPNDKLAKLSRLKTRAKGGIIINDYCQTSDSNIYAIGECSCWKGNVYGLVAPGYKMAQVVVSHLLGNKLPFTGINLSAKLKLVNVDVGFICSEFNKKSKVRNIVYLDEQKSVYKKLIICENNKKLLAAILVGDILEYNTLLQYSINSIELPENPDSLILPSYSFGKPIIEAEVLSNDAIICYCHNLIKSDIIRAIDAGCHSIKALKEKLKVGSVCGGCIYFIAQILDAELKRINNEK